MLVVFFNSMESETSAWTPGARCQSVLEKGARVHTVVCIVMAAALLPIEEHAVWHLGCSPRAAHVYKVVLQTWGTA